MKRIAVLASGNGSNLQAILDAVQAGRLRAGIEIVVSDNESAYALERARRSSIQAVYFAYPPRSDGRQARCRRDVALADMLLLCGVSHVVLVGWMRVLSDGFLGRFPMRVINLHPALPGQFPGTHAIARAFEAFKAGSILQTGVMVHWVPDEGVDNGPVILQEPVPILETDDLDTLTARVHQVEHGALVEALALVLHGPD